MRATRSGVIDGAAWEARQLGAGREPSWTNPSQGDCSTAIAIAMTRIATIQLAHRRLARA